MPTLDIYDPPMCCSTGVCGPQVDPALTRFAADLDWLQSQGITVNRYNLAQEPAAFAGQPLIRKLLEENDGDGLPALLIDGELAYRGAYPDRETLSGSLGLSGEGEAEEELSLQTRHLLALAASIAVNNQEAFRHHHAELRRMGVGEEQMLAAADIALQIKQATDVSMLQLAETCLAPQGQGSCCSGGGCCG